MDEWAQKGQTDGFGVSRPPNQDIQLHFDQPAMTATAKEEVQRMSVDTLNDWNRTSAFIVLDEIIKTSGSSVGKPQSFVSISEILIMLRRVA